LAAHETVRRVHGDGANARLAEVRCNLEHEAAAVIRGFKRVVDIRQRTIELDVDDGADHLRHAAFSLLCHLFLVRIHQPRWAAIPSSTTALRSRPPPPPRKAR